MKYFIRSVKYFVYIVVIFVILVNIIFFTSQRQPGIDNFTDLFKDGSLWQMLALFIAFSAVYPVLGYYNKKIYTNNNFAAKKQSIIDYMTNGGRYMLTDDSNGRLTFRIKSPFIRFMRLYEDAIVIDYTSNPVIMSGLRKEVVRYSRNIETIIQSEE